MENKEIFYDNFDNLDNFLLPCYRISRKKLKEVERT